MFSCTTITTAISLSPHSDMEDDFEFLYSHFAKTIHLEKAADGIIPDYNHIKVIAPKVFVLDAIEPS